MARTRAKRNHPPHPAKPGLESMPNGGSASGLTHISCRHLSSRGCRGNSNLNVVPFMTDTFAILSRHYLTGKHEADEVHERIRKQGPSEFKNALFMYFIFSCFPVIFFFLPLIVGP
jgi:hypothetical protein